MVITGLLVSVAHPAHTGAETQWPTGRTLSSAIPRAAPAPTSAAGSAVTCGETPDDSSPNTPTARRFRRSQRPDKVLLGLGMPVLVAAGEANHGLNAHLSSASVS